MTTVSVVLATYNGARYLEEQLASLASQTRLPSELIISDDGSADDTLDIAKAFSLTAPFPVKIQQNCSRLGYGGNFLNAAKLATANYIAFCDQDDIWHPDKLKVATDRLLETGACLFVHTAQLIDGAGQRIGVFQQGIRAPEVHRPLELNPWSVFYGFTMAFQRKLIDLIDPAWRGPHIFEFKGLLSHDLWIYFLATSLGSVVADDRALACYRQHQANQTPHVRAGLRTWVRLLGVAAHPELRRDEIAMHRSEILQRLGSTADDAGLREAATRASHYWRRISNYERARLQFYAANGLLRRAAGILRLAGRGGYRSFHHGGLGWRLFLKDALVGVLGVRRVKA